MLRTTMLLLAVVMTGTVPFHAAAVQLPKTGQSRCYNSNGTEVVCAGSGQDGEKQAGAAWPSPRFRDNANGTVTDNLTGLVWLKNANCTDTVNGIAKTGGSLAWAAASFWSRSLASGACGLTDGSKAGQWRMPNREELLSLVDWSRYNPVLPSGHPFTAVQLALYWSSDWYATDIIWCVGMGTGSTFKIEVNYYDNYVWPVRAGQ